jgi:hypothetical protein
MRRLSVTESSEGHETSATLTSVKIERNRLISWDRTVKGLNKPDGVSPSSKNSITIGTLVFVRKVTKLFAESLAKLPYALFKLGYEIAKLVTQVLFNIRRLLFLKNR